MHSLVHLGDVIRSWGPIIGFVWTYPLERWIAHMKAILHSTKGLTLNIAGNLQLINAAALLRLEMHEHYAVQKDNPFLFGCPSPVAMEMLPIRFQGSTNCSGTCMAAREPH